MSKDAETCWQVTKWDDAVNGGDVILVEEFSTEQEAILVCDELRQRGVVANVNEWPEIA